GQKSLTKTRSLKAPRAARNKASAVGAPNIRQPAARDAIHHRQSQCRARLAGETARVRERKRRSLDGLHRLRLDRPAAWNQKPQGSIQDGFGRDRVDYPSVKGKVTYARKS